MLSPRVSTGAWQSPIMLHAAGNKEQKMSEQKVTLEVCSHSINSLMLNKQTENWLRTWSRAWTWLRAVWAPWESVWSPKRNINVTLQRSHQQCWLFSLDSILIKLHLIKGAAIELRATVCASLTCSLFGHLFVYRTAEVFFSFSFLFTLGSTLCWGALFLHTQIDAKCIK